MTHVSFTKMIRVYKILARCGVLGRCARFVRAHPEHLLCTQQRQYGRTLRADASMPRVGRYDNLVVTGKQQLALRLRAKGYTIDAIAAEMNITQRAAFALLRRAYASAEKLKQRFIEFVGEE